MRCRTLVTLVMSPASDGRSEFVKFEAISQNQNSFSERRTAGEYLFFGFACQFVMNALSLFALNPLSQSSPTPTIESNRRNRMFGRIFSVMLVVLCVCMLMTVCVFAANNGTEIQTGMDTGMENLWKILKGISYGVAVAFVAVSAFKLVFGGQKGMEAAKLDFIKAVIFAVIVIFAPSIVSAMFSWFSSSTVTYTNPFNG